jgi:lipopolysaccharide heptosyltransferase II
MNKILIFNPFGIGDVLFTTPIIRSLKNNLKDISISYLCNRRTYPLLKNNIFLDKVLIFEKDEWRVLAKHSKRKFIKEIINFFRRIKKDKFDIIFDLSLNSSYGFFFKMLGIKKRIGFNFKNRGRFLTHKIELPFGYKDKHVSRYYLELIKFVDIYPYEYKFDLFLSKEALRKAEKMLSILGLKKDDSIIGVCPGSGDSWQNTAYFKRWPKENFLKLCSILQEEFNVNIILFGSKIEKDLCDYIYEGMKKKPINLCGKINLEEFCAMVSFCKVIITNDGGPFHIAQALEKKVLVFFGPVDERVYGAYPTDKNCIVLKKDLSCRPCYKEFKFKGCSFDKRCLRDIKVEEVMLSFKKIIGKI